MRMPILRKRLGKTPHCLSSFFPFLPPPPLSLAPLVYSRRSRERSRPSQCPFFPFPFSLSPPSSPTARSPSGKRNGDNPHRPSCGCSVFLLSFPSPPPPPPPHPQKPPGLFQHHFVPPFLSGAGDVGGRDNHSSKPASTRKTPFFFFPFLPSSPPLGW